MIPLAWVTLFCVRRQGLYVCQPLPPINTTSTAGSTASGKAGRQNLLMLTHTAVTGQLKALAECKIQATHHVGMRGTRSQLIMFNATTKGSAR